VGNQETNSLFPRFSQSRFSLYLTSSREESKAGGAKVADKKSGDAERGQALVRSEGDIPHLYLGFNQESTQRLSPKVTTSSVPGFERERSMDLRWEVNFSWRVGEAIDRRRPGWTSELASWGGGQRRP
jgi:hypothetical protein